MPRRLLPLALVVLLIVSSLAEETVAISDAWVGILLLLLTFRVGLVLTQFDPREQVEGSPTPSRS